MYAKIERNNKRKRDNWTLLGCFLLSFLWLSRGTLTSAARNSGVAPTGVTAFIHRSISRQPVKSTNNRENTFNNRTAGHSPGIRWNSTQDLTDRFFSFLSSFPSVHPSSQSCVNKPNRKDGRAAYPECESSSACHPKYDGRHRVK